MSRVGVILDLRERIRHFDDALDSLVIRTSYFDKKTPDISNSSVIFFVKIWKCRSGAKTETGVHAKNTKSNFFPGRKKPATDRHHRYRLTLHFSSLKQHQRYFVLGSMIKLFLRLRKNHFLQIATRHTRNHIQ